MSKSFNFEGMGIFGLALGLLATGYAVYQTNKLSKTTSKLDMSIADVESKTQIDIDQSIVDKALQNAVDKKVERAASEAVAAVKSDFHQTIYSAVKKEVDEQYTRISDEVGEKVTKEIEGITKEKISNSIQTRLQPELKKYGENKIDQMVADVRDTAMKNLSTNLDYASAGAKVFKEFLSNGIGGGSSSPRPTITF